MNKFLKENFSKILIIFILLQPIIDLITGICVHIFNLNITFGIIIRVLFLLFLIYETIIIHKRKASFYIYLGILIYSLLYLIGIIVYKDGVLFREVQGLVKTFYFPLVLISLYDLKSEFKISKMVLFTTLFSYLLLILIPNILNLGFESYTVAKIGSLGFFNSANELSGIISILTPVMFIILKEVKNNVFRVTASIIYLVVILTIGTKTPLLTLLITIGLSYLYYMVINIKKKTFKPIIYSGLVLVVGCCSLLLVLPKTNFYKNIRIHLDYLEVDTVFDILKDKKLIDHFIFSSRLAFMDKKVANYNESSMYEHLFGIGYTKDTETTKLIEMDYFDILYSHGVVGFIIFFTPLIYVFYQLYTTRKKENSSYEKYMLKLSVFLLFILALLTGHILTAPAVALIVVILILYLSKRNKKEVLFATVNFDIGGIETSLINLLNQFDYSKYNVTVILEEKIGILLPRVNKNATIQEVKVSAHSNVFIRKFINLSNKLIFTIVNYHNYDFSSCYATYSLSSNLLARIASKNTAFYIHSNYKYIYDKDDFLNFFNARHINDFKHLIFVAEEAKNDFLKYYPQLTKKCLVFANFIDPDLVLEKSKVELSVKKPKDKKLLVFVGRLDDHAKKLLRAIHLVNEIPSLALWIIGDGPDRAMYEKEVKRLNLEKSITFFGGKENPYPYMKMCDYVILTSDYEGFPLIYLEAITLGKEIITTIDVSDSQLNIGKDYAHIVSKDEKQMLREVEKILVGKPKMKKVDFKKLQKEKFKRLEKVFNEVV